MDMLKKLKPQTRLGKKVIATLVTTFTAFALLFSNPVLPEGIKSEVYAETLDSSSFRLAGTSRYETAIKVSQEGWEQAGAVVLARGDDFPDALAGAVLANSSQASGPLLLTETGTLTDGVLSEIKRLQAKKVYILGGTGAVSSTVENTLKGQNLTVERLDGVDRFETATKIALKGIPSSTEAFIASGNSFADALSISSYAASQGIPLLLTDTGSVPEVTLKTLKTLGVQKITLIGGEGVILPSVKTQLEAQKYTVERLSGLDRYATNLKVLNTLTYNAKSIYVATGEDFPDALAGAVLAAKQNNPIVLVPKKDVSTEGMGYLGVRRIEGSLFTMLGGVGVISSSLESMIRTGSVNPRISLQYLQAYGTGSALYQTYLKEINFIPGKATDSVDYVAPHWYNLDLIPSGQTMATGSITGPWDTASPYFSQVVATAHARGLKVLPSLAADWNEAGKAAVDSVLKNEGPRKNLVQNIEQMLKSTGADGIIVDFEYMSDDSGPALTQFMKELYTTLHGQNKLVVQAVPARISATDWNKEFNYQDLAQYVDYLNIMTYDYSTSVPGPIAPLGWNKKVLEFAKSQKVDMSKVIMGIPYYGRDWKQTGENSYTKGSVGLYTARDLVRDYSATLTRETSPDDSIGIPTFTYTDKEGKVHKVYFDDPQSWGAKLALVNDYGLAGVGAWSLYWMTEETAKEVFPLLQRYLR
jgi:spore germination protein YaaH/putative cell wall-binding protein